MTNKKDSRFVPPFRLGRKQKRAILDANGIEIVIFPVGQEIAAQHFLDYLNSLDVLSFKKWNIDWA